MAKKDKSCFVIGPIGEPKSEIREWADKILKFVILPALKKCGYENPIRADQISKPGMITFEIVQHLILDDLVIADLTWRNANVYYELGILHAARKPFVQVIREGEEIPFDAKDLRTIKIGTDVEIAAKASSELETYIPEVEKLGTKINTPVSVVAEIEVLRTSGRSQEQAVGELLSKMEDMRSSIIDFGMKLNAVSQYILNPLSQFNQVSPFSPLPQYQTPYVTPGVPTIFSMEALAKALEALKPISEKAKSPEQEKSA